MFQFVSWDFTVNADSYMVFNEANLHSQVVWCLQIANRKAVLGNDTAIILDSIKKK